MSPKQEITQLPIKRQMDKTGTDQTRERRSAVRRNELLIYTTTRVNVGNSECNRPDTGVYMLCHPFT